MTYYHWLGAKSEDIEEEIELEQFFREVVTLDGKPIFHVHQDGTVTTLAEHYNHED